MSRLSDVKVGEKARVIRVEGADEVGCRLLEMGMTAGIEVKVLGAAPWGDPIEVELRGYRLSLRKTEANRVEVDPA